MTVDVVWQEKHFQQSETLDLVQKHLEKSIASYEVVDCEYVLMPSGDFALGLFFNRGVRMFGCVISSALKIEYTSPNFHLNLKREVIEVLSMVLI